MEKQKSCVVTGKALWVIVLLFTVVLLGSCGPQQFKAPVFHPNDNEGWGPSGLTWNGRNFVMGENRKIAEVGEIETGLFLNRDFPYNSEGFFKFAHLPRSLQTPARICGLAWEGECCGRGFLWITDSLNKEIIKTNSDDYSVLMRLPAPGESPSGLVYDGKTLWVADSKASLIFNISPQDGSVIRKYQSPLKTPVGLAWDCNDIWILGYDTCKSGIRDCYEPRLVKLELKSSKVTHEISLPSPMIKPVSLVWVDGVMWISDAALNRVFRVASSGYYFEDETVYMIAAAPKTEAPQKPRPIAIQTVPPVPPAEDKSVDEAKKAADEARKSADEARKSADEAKKAFELQQKK